MKGIGEISPEKFVKPWQVSYYFNSVLIFNLYNSSILQLKLKLREHLSKPLHRRGSSIYFSLSKAQEKCQLNSSRIDLIIKIL